MPSRPATMATSGDTTSDQITLYGATRESNLRPLLPLFKAEIPRKIPAESAADAWSQDAKPDKTGYQRPIPLAATESPTTEAKEASPSADSTEQEEAKEPAKEESPCTEMPTPEPSSMGEGAAQIPQDQEVEVPCPTMDDSAALFESCALRAIRAPAISDGVTEAPVATEIEPEQPIDDRHTEEPTAETESDEAPINSSSDDGASEAPTTTEIGPEQPINDRWTGAESGEAPINTASDDGASERPFTTEIEPEQPIGDRQTEEPTAEADSSEALITTASDDDASKGPVATDTKPGELASDRQPEEITAGVESDKVPGNTTSQDGAPRSTDANETTPLEPLSNATMEATVETESEQTPFEFNGDDGVAEMPRIRNDHVTDENAMAGPSASEPMDVEDSNAPGEALPMNPIPHDGHFDSTSELRAQAADQSSEAPQYSGTDIDMDVELDQDEEMSDKSLAAGGMHQDSYGSTTSEPRAWDADAFNQMPDSPDDLDLVSHDDIVNAPGTGHANASNEMPQFAEEMDTNEQGGFAGGVAPRFASAPIETPQAGDVDMAGYHDVADYHGSVNATVPIEKQQSKEIEMQDAEDAWAMSGIDSISRVQGQTTWQSFSHSQGMGSSINPAQKMAPTEIPSMQSTPQMSQTTHTPPVEKGSRFKASKQKAPSVRKVLEEIEKQQKKQELQRQQAIEEERLAEQMQQAQQSAGQMQQAQQLLQTPLHKELSARELLPAQQLPQTPIPSTQRILAAHEVSSAQQLPQTSSSSTQRIPAAQGVAPDQQSPQITQPEQPRQTQKKQAEEVRDSFQVRWFCDECPEDYQNVVEGEENNMVCGNCGLVLEEQGVDLSARPDPYPDYDPATYYDEDETPTGFDDDETPANPNAKSDADPTANESPAQTESPSTAPPQSTPSRATTVVVDGRRKLGVHKPQPVSQSMGSETFRKPDRDNQLYTFDAGSGATRAAGLIDDWFVDAQNQVNVFRAHNDVSLRTEVGYRIGPLGRVIDHMRWTIQFLENGQEDWDLAGPDWSAKFLGDVIDKTEELIRDYERLGKTKNCRDIFHPMLQDMARISFKLLPLWNKKPKAEKDVVMEERKKKRKAEEERMKAEAEEKERKAKEKKMAALNRI
jgi:hypothetical protein